MYPTSNVLYRVFSLRILANDAVVSGGTMFVIEVDGREYCVTARHIAAHIGDSGIEIMQHNNWVSYSAKLVGHGEGKVDVSVFALPSSIIPMEARFPLPMGTNGVRLGEEMMFLGFPGVYDPSLGFNLHNGFPIPLVKYARVSALPSPEGLMWLDRHNNRGFSGSPICFSPKNDNELVVASVVSAYSQSMEPIVSRGGDETGLYMRENTGLMLAWDIRHCVELARLNPIGTEVG